MLRRHRLGAMMKSGVSQRSSLTAVHIHTFWRYGALYFLNLSWFSAFDFRKNAKYACDRKFMPKVIKIELGMTKLLKKKMMQFI